MTHEGVTRTPHGQRQDEQWAQFVAQLRSQPHRPFAEQWTSFQAIYGDRRDSDDPPLAWRPSEEQVTDSNLWQVMEQMGFDRYAQLHAWSVDKRAEFWEKVIDRLGVVVAKKPDAIVDLGSGVTDPRWLPGAEMNCVDSCFTASPERPAVVSGREGSEDLTVTTYGELEGMVNRFANGLRERGFGTGDRIALYMPMTVECVAAYLGVVRAGCCVVSIADSFSPAEVSKRLEVSGATSIVSVEGYVRAGKTVRLFDKVKDADAPPAIVIAQDAGDGVTLRRQDVLWTDFLSSNDSFTSAAADPYSMINVLFSSGTTGTPKAIPWTHLAPIKCAMDGHFHQDIHARDLVAWPSNIGWMMGPWLIFATLLNKATMALYEGAPLGEGFIRFVSDAKVTVLGVVPSLVRAWRTSGALGAEEWDGIRLFSSTGEPSNQEDYLWLMSRVGYRAPIIEYLGGTEIGGGHLTGAVVQAASPATFTTPALGIDLVILDEGGKQVGEGKSGELYLIPPAIGLSQNLLNGDHDKVYYGDCPTGPSGEVLRRHGDQIRRLYGGFFKAEGRADDAMNLGGIKVGSIELERILGAHDAVSECAAIGVPPEGEGAEKLVVFVILAREIAVERLATELASTLAKELNPLFKIHDLVITDELPRTTSNKLMRRKLRALYLQRKT